MNRPAEEDIHAYVDGRLGCDDRQCVDRWLQANPAEAERVKVWQQQAAGLHRLFDPVLEESVPDRLSRLGSGTASISWRMAAAVGWLSLGLLLGYGLHDKPAAADAFLTTLVRPAAIAHAVYSPEVRHPVEVGAEQQAHLVQWLSKRLGTAVLAPDLQAAGFQLLGGRLLPGDSTAAAQFMYQDGAGRRVTLYVRKEVSGNQETAFRYAKEKGLAVFYWVDGRAGYALSGDLPRQQLLHLAELSYRDLERQHRH